MTSQKNFLLFINLFLKNNPQLTPVFLLYNLRAPRLHYRNLKKKLKFISVRPHKILSKFVRRPVGKRLTQAKSLVQHGEWRIWLENNFTLDERTAQRFMQISERFSGKSVAVDVFKPSQLTEMLALPDAEETKKFIEQKAAEGTPVSDMSIKTLRKELKKWKAKKADDTKEKSVEDQIETQKQPTPDENTSVPTDTQPENVFHDDYEEKFLIDEQSYPDPSEQDTQFAQKAVELFNFDNTDSDTITIPSAMSSVPNPLDILFRTSNELLTMPDLKQKIFDFASGDPEGFNADIDNLFKVVDIIREVDNRKSRSDFMP